MKNRITTKTILLDFLRANNCDGFTNGHCWCTIKDIETEASMCSVEDYACEPYRTIAGSRMELSDIEEYEKNVSSVPKKKYEKN